MTTTLAMMQPYWFPYLGYFQLIAAADAFVLGDDLQYIKDGWINRNRILCGGAPWMFSLPLKKAAHGLAINQRELADDTPAAMAKLLKTLALHYARAPHQAEVLPLLETLMLHPERNLARYLEHSLRKTCDYLGITTPILIASDLHIREVQDKQDRVIKTMHKLGGQRYLNPVGGLDLYDQATFSAAGLELRFHRMNAIEYPQLKGPFVPYLSIIDVLMFNPVERIRHWLPDFACLMPKPAAGAPLRSEVA
ncbi:WbqC family protein [Pseudomonas sp. NPDC007930]|uniref:WbqC family protein n=1 Tax=Pseudomonas sp. NPDC007930 TaxID=3364417 RepID=UPI0036E65D9A